MRRPPTAALLAPVLLALLAGGLAAEGVDAQPTLTVDASAGPSLTRLGASGAVEVIGFPIPVGEVEFPTSVGVDARLRVGLSGPAWGARLGVGYLGASDVFDGASVLGQRSVDVAFLVASAEATVRRPLANGGEAVLGVGPELRSTVGKSEGLLAALGDVQESHLAVGVSVGTRFRMGGLVLGPEARAGLALTPLSDDEVSVLGGRIRLAGAFRFNHASVSLTVGTE
ncbi:MAG: hypothetical protein AAGK21_18175 [Bacteroidota bacterium]